MAENKTTETDASVEAFLHGVADEKRRNDSFEVLDMMKEITGLEPKMWGPSIVGFGSYHYKYESGREGDSPLIGFSPRKQAMTLHIGGLEQYGDQLEKLGKHTTGSSCLYIKRLSDVDLPTLKNLIEVSYRDTKKFYGVE